MEIAFSMYFKIALALVLVYIIQKFITYQNKRKQMKNKIEKKLSLVCQDKAKLECDLKSHKDPLLDERRSEIVKLPVYQLVQSLQDGSLTCLEVLKAYQIKALEITKDLNCVTEFIKEAEEWAKTLDRDGGLEGKKGPLHGVPFSVKDNTSVSGYDCTIGLTKNLHQPADEDAAMVAALKSLGAIPFCKTNIPQTMLSVGCSNPIWGLTRNPHNRERTPGGSSGGEGCLVAAGGSPFGIGSDIGGSARIPAAFCGVPSIKVTNLRLSYKGFRKSAVNCVGLHAVPGIIARDADTVTMLSKFLLEDSYLHQNFDPDILPIPWNETRFTSTRKLRIGYYEDDGFFPTTPGIRRAVQLARRQLEQLGHELVPFAPPRVGTVVNSVINILNADGGLYQLRALSVDDIDPVLKLSVLGIKLPYFVKVMVKPIISLLSPRLVYCFMAGGGYRLRFSHQLWNELTVLNEYKEEFLALWRELKLDLCIAPCYGCPAPLSKDIGRLIPVFSYTCLYNYIDFPVGIVPVTKENEEDQIKLNEYNYNDIVCRLVKNTTKGAIGMPLSLQVIGLPYHEETVLRGMRILESVAEK